jgi:hypothetical protein
MSESGQGLAQLQVRNGRLRISWPVMRDQVEGIEDRGVGSLMTASTPRTVTSRQCRTQRLPPPIVKLLALIRSAPSVIERSSVVAGLRDLIAPRWWSVKLIGLLLVAWQPQAAAGDAWQDRPKETRRWRHCPHRGAQTRAFQEARRGLRAHRADELSAGLIWNCSPAARAPAA